VVLAFLTAVGERRNGGRHGYVILRIDSSWSPSLSMSLSASISRRVIMIPGAPT
jgi:hypothetical protein